MSEALWGWAFCTGDGTMRKRPGPPSRAIWSDKTVVNSILEVLERPGGHEVWLAKGRICFRPSSIHATPFTYFREKQP